MMWRACCIFILILLTSSCYTWAQHNSRLGFFQVDRNKGCFPLTVTITLNPGYQCNASASLPCDVNFGDGSSGSFVATHQYNQPGKYKLSLLIQVNPKDDIDIEVLPNDAPQVDVYTHCNNTVTVKVTGIYDSYALTYSDGGSGMATNTSPHRYTFASAGPKSVTVKGLYGSAYNTDCGQTTRTFTTMATIPTPVISQLQVMDNASIQLTYNNAPDMLYRLEIAGNSNTNFQLLKTTYNLANETVANLKPDDNYYCFRLATTEPCNGATLYSNIICSANFDLSVQNKSNNLTWVTSTTGVSNLTLNRTPVGASLPGTVTGSARADTDINCGTRYCYQLITNYSGTRSISLEKCGVAISTDIPAAIQNITAMVDQPALDLQWQPIAGFTPATFSVFRSAGTTYNLLTQTTTPQARDEAYFDMANNYCYKISYVDVCNNQSPLSAEACPVRLTGTLQRDNAINLSWTPYSGWRNGIQEYIVEKYDDGGQLLETFTPGTATVLTDGAQDPANQSYTYVVKVNATEPGLPQAISNMIVVTKDPNLFYPTAFTPNDDNLNDLFNVYGQYIVGFEMNIFNRWGELMFATTDLEQGWDGSFRGNPMPEGTYTFVAEITDRAGRTFKRSGSTLLLRKK